VSVTLRRATPDDAAFLLELVSDDDTRPFLSGRAADDVAAQIERSQSEPDDFGWFVVECEGEPAGCVAFHRVSEQHGIAEGGRFVIHPRFRGRGLGVEAARAFQRLLLLELGFHRIELQVYGFNERALVHAERSGYVREGVKRKAYRRHGEWQDAVLFSLLREDLADE
jgi:RimJ/RimL family protein N-acetyltransferase